MLDMPSLSDLDGFAGFAALVNSLLLWPTVRGLQTAVSALREEIAGMKKTRRKATARKRR